MLGRGKGDAKDRNEQASCFGGMQVSHLGQAVVLNLTCPAVYTCRLVFAFFPLSFREQIRMKGSAGDQGYFEFTLVTKVHHLQTLVF